MKDIVDGQDIVDLRCLGSMYDRGTTIEAVGVDGEKYRIKVKEFLKLINDVKFVAEKKVKYRHLTVKE